MESGKLLRPRNVNDQISNSSRIYLVLGKLFYNSHTIYIKQLLLLNII